MPPPLRRLDPDGYYDRLGLEPSAAQADIVAAYRMKARVLHPDVPGTGNTAAFVAIKQAYDVLSSRPKRLEYDRAARAAAMEAIVPEVIDPKVIHPGVIHPKVIHNMPAQRGRPAWPAPSHRPRLSDLPVLVWAGMAVFLLFCVYQVVSHLLAPTPTIRADIRPNAAVVPPLSPSAHQAVLYGPAPVRLAGAPNFYVTPAGTPAVLWRQENNAMVASGQLPPFSAVQAVRFMRQTGMLEVLVDDRGNGFVSADHVTPGNTTAARRAYCSYNAGTTPSDGELLALRGHGHGKLILENRAAQPAVLKLRDESGGIMLAVFLRPGGSAALDGLPEGTYRPEFAIGELWSRACNTFAAGMRARRMNELLRLLGDSRLVVATDAVDAPSTDIPDQAFDRN